MVKQELFGDFDLINGLLNPDFKEDSVREVIILPIIKKLGYQESEIVRGITLSHPYLKIGANNKIPIRIRPDYCFKIDNCYAWVLDAKGPGESVVEYNHIEQVYSYASHPEIRSVYFALCNGVEFILFRRESNNSPVLHFSICEIDKYWEDIVTLLSPSSFQTGKQHFYSAPSKQSGSNEFDYVNRPLLDELPVQKQKAKRHFGVHGYFTKQSWNVVAEYIKNYTKPGDMVLDPFGGSGVTAVEALMTNRSAICIDINPLAVFLTKTLISPLPLTEFSDAFVKIKKSFERHVPNTPVEIQHALEKYSYPIGFKLPKGSDVETVDQLFSEKQLAHLSLLKHLICLEKNENIKENLLLMFSGLITKANLTYHNNPNRPAAGQGNAAPFAYYRYRIAPHPVDIDLMTYFELRYKKLLSAKEEMHYYINQDTYTKAQIVKGSATDLKFIPKESVDYIYTDPPYGKKIPYLDLSTMWNAWLDLDVDETDYALEAIEGGDHHKSKSEYNQLISESIKQMYRVLKFDRWMSFVFAHKDPEFWHLIIETAENCGFEYVGAVPQKNGQTSFKKRQHPFTVLSGQLIINFRKVRRPKSILKANLGMDIAEIVTQSIEGIIAKDHGATLEQINDELIIRGLELGFLDLLKKEYSDLTPLLLEQFDYVEDSEKYYIKKDKRFQTHIDVRLRVSYYLQSFLTRMENQNKTASFDDIVTYIMPLLKNGITPEHQTILSVLENLGEHVGNGCWRLKQNRDWKLFD